eukprot:gnl/TRDRNA2_/TRDRNA2_59010_c1_seq1.p2 gnl/TRDRNA2_/TRDRNA2_59010_c1~~gnl/TRDRNA2_/TRDRNA2_59010_c1_seq1.p2  ORF type:complete len:170 (+),score=3.61 gnl/TRDRNA2_/TRDRNA2_59010_c1_seq1:11-520(+)
MRHCIFVLCQRLTVPGRAAYLRIDCERENVMTVSVYPATVPTRTRDVVAGGLAGPEVGIPTAEPVMIADGVTRPEIRVPAAKAVIVGVVLIRSGTEVQKKIAAKIIGASVTRQQIGTSRCCKNHKWCMLVPQLVPPPPGALRLCLSDCCCAAELALPCTAFAVRPRAHF